MVRWGQAILASWRLFIDSEPASTVRLLAGCGVARLRRGQWAVLRPAAAVCRGGRPWRRYPWDVLGLFPITDQGNRYLLVSMDYFAKWPVANAVPDQSAATIADRLVSKMCCFSAPVEQHCDQGWNFKAPVCSEDSKCQLSTRLEDFELTAWVDEDTKPAFMGAMWCAASSGMRDVVLCQNAVWMREWVIYCVLMFEFGMSCGFSLWFILACIFLLAIRVGVFMIHPPVWFFLMFWCLIYPCPLSCACIQYISPCPSHIRVWMLVPSVINGKEAKDTTVPTLSVHCLYTVSKPSLIATIGFQFWVFDRWKY